MRALLHPFHGATHRQPTPRLKIAVLGAWYWGPNLARNSQESPDWELMAICDLEWAVKFAATAGDIAVVESFDKLLDTFDVDAVALATPTRTSHGTVVTALRAGKHVLGPPNVVAAQVMKRAWKTTVSERAALQGPFQGVAEVKGSKIRRSEA
jgi:hypothetical protein